MSTAAITESNVPVATSDSELRRRVRQELSASGYRALRDVAVDVHLGLVTLRGTVTNYYEKQLAQAAAMRVDDVESLRNEIVVARRENR
jgi:osmotically-inducible protein OsmY